MDVLMFSRRFFPQKGGVEKYVLNISKEFIKDGYSVSVITEKAKLRDKSNEKIFGINIVRLNYPKIKYLGLFVLWFKILKNIRLIKKADVILIHDIFIFFLPFRFLFFKKKVITTFHGWEGVFPIPIKNIVHKKLAYFLSNKTIAVGDYIGKWYRIKPDYVVYGGCEKHKSTQKDMRQIVYVGRLSPDTGLKLFLKLYRKLTGFKIDFCGDGEMRIECEKYGVVHGFCDPDRFYRRAGICFAGGYLSVLESLSYGCCPIVFYDNKLKKDYYALSPFKDFIISGESVDAVQEKLFELLSNKKRLSSFVRRGRAFSKKYSWRRVYKVLIKAYTMV